MLTSRFLLYSKFVTWDRKLLRNPQQNICETLPARLRKETDLTDNWNHMDGKDEMIKHIALLEELETSVKLIHLGFGELQNINKTNDFHFLHFQLLSQGFERLMKCYICLAYFDTNGKYPDFKFVKDLGHDLEKLLSIILEDYFVVKNHPTLISDKQFISESKELKELLYILSEFGKLARYHNFDVITGSKKPSINPNEMWSKFGNKFVFSNPESMQKLFDWELQDEIYGELSRHILIQFEKFVSAISRQFLFDCIGEKAKQFSTCVFDFAMLYPENLGNTNYRSNTTRYKSKEKKVHKRDLNDEYQRRTNPNFKSRKIKKSDYDGDWPFYSDEVIIECRDKHWCIVTIDGFDYALNGASQGRYKLENVHEAGMAILGKGIGDFITMANNL